MEKAIYFDMDGTIADLYGVENWLDMLRDNSEKPYLLAKPMYSKEQLQEVITELKQKGIKIGVVSWCSKVSTPEFDNRIRKAKRKWLKEFFPFADEIHIVRYGTPKYKVVNERSAILVDDEEKNLVDWTRGRTIDANGDIVLDLKIILEELDHVC